MKVQVDNIHKIAENIYQIDFNNNLSYVVISKNEKEAINKAYKKYKLYH